jgi:hypothetical protein
VVVRHLALLALALLLCACGVSSDVSRALGARCEMHDECDDRCLTGPEFPLGMCSESCDRDSACPEGASCADVEGGVCLFACRDDDGCAFLGAGWTCRSEPERGAQPGDEVTVCIGPS